MIAQVGDGEAQAILYSAYFASLCTDRINGSIQFRNGCTGITYRLYVLCIDETGIANADTDAMVGIIVAYFVPRGYRLLNHQSFSEFSNHPL